MMKKNMFMLLLLFAGTTAFAQEKPAVKTDAQKWKIRARVIAAIPASTIYTISKSDVKASASVMPEVDFTYFFTKNIAAELILGTTQHKIKLVDATSTTKLGKVWLLPPTLNLQYHIPLHGFTPYIGAGINYSIFYGVKDDQATLSYKNKVGFSTQLGFDYNINDKWFINLDVKKIFLKTDVTVEGAAPVLLSGVKINPFIIGAGVGVKF